MSISREQRNKLVALVIGTALVCLGWIAIASAAEEASPRITTPAGVINIALDLVFLST
ncbi:MAG TPA: hypothetical protein VKV03_06445 [Candidatus Binataceae bacterium]|nr:hypothetical protein [Candidatus Binataceae bacterium]